MAKNIKESKDKNNLKQTNSNDKTKSKQTNSNDKTKSKQTNNKMNPKKTDPSKKSKIVFSRIATGIEGFDNLVDGGIPQNSFVLLKGSTGTGKSIFGINYLAHGAKNGEPGVYVSLEEGFEENKVQMGLFGWEIDNLIKENKLMIIQPRIYNFDKLVETIQDAIYSIKAKRIVIDSISILGLYFEDAFKTRRNILDLARTLKTMDVTTLAISEEEKTTGQNESIGVEEFVSDGVINLYLEKKSNLMSRAIGIRKMRSTDHSLKIHPIKIQKPKGIVVYPFEESFEDF